MWSLLVLAIISARVVAYVQPPHDFSPRTNIAISEVKLSAYPSPSLGVKPVAKSTPTPSPRALPTGEEKNSVTDNPAQRKEYPAPITKLTPTEITKTLDRCLDHNCISPTPKPTITINPIRIYPSPFQPRPTGLPQPEITKIPDPTPLPKPSDCPPAPPRIDKNDTQRNVFEDPIYCLDWD